jgi:hypothetical protein
MRTRRGIALLALIAIAPIAACEKDFPTAPAPFLAAAGAAPVPANASIVIRGTSTAGSVFEIGDISAGIESVEVLKGASMQALYGKQCDMVIVISTRRHSPPAAPSTGRHGAPGSPARQGLPRETSPVPTRLTPNARSTARGSRTLAGLSSPSTTRRYLTRQRSAQP